MPAPRFFHGSVDANSRRDLTHTVEHGESFGTLRLVNLANEQPNGGYMVGHEGVFRIVEGPIDSEELFPVKIAFNGVLVYFSSPRGDTSAIASRIEINKDTFNFASSPLDEL
jgi:hypothetical protein